MHFFPELHSCQSYVALKRARHENVLILSSRVLDLKSCQKGSIFGTFSGRVRGPPHGFGVEKSCCGSQKTISLTLPETSKTSRNFWKFCVFDEIFIFSRHFSLSEVMQSHGRTQRADVRTYRYVAEVCVRSWAHIGNLSSRPAITGLHRFLATRER